MQAPAVQLQSTFWPKVEQPYAPPGPANSPPALPKTGSNPRKRDNSLRRKRKPKSGCEFLTSVLDGIDYQALLEELDNYRWTGGRYIGRKGYQPRAMLRLYLAKHLLNIRYDVDLLEHANNSPELREICGFDGDLPSPSAFSRFRTRLLDHLPRFGECIVKATNELRPLLPTQKKRPGRPVEQLPPLGEVVAVDSSVFDSFSNPNRKTKAGGVSDPDARWGLKHSAKAKDGNKEWGFGYKLHLSVDASHNLPLDFIVTPANASDSKMLAPLLQKTQQTYSWFQPKFLLADRGYDAQKNFWLLWQQSIEPVIKIRKPTASDGLYDGTYTRKGTPVCLGKQAMEYLRTDPVTGQHQFRCPSGGCSLKAEGTKAVTHCDTVEWEDPAKNLRVLGGRVARASKEWRELYRKRYSVERVFRSLKHSRGLEGHRMRGLLRVTLLAMTALLTFQSTALARARAGDFARLRLMRLKVA